MKYVVHKENKQMIKKIYVRQRNIFVVFLLIYSVCYLRKPYVQASVYVEAKMMTLLDIDTAVVLVAKAVIYHISDI